VESVVLEPVYANFNNSLKMVGMFGANLVWEDVLGSIFRPQETGIDCVIKSGDQAFTFSIVDGSAVYRGNADLHETQYSKYEVWAALKESDSSSAASATNTIHFYPSDEWFAQYSTSNPQYATIRVVCAMVTTSILFVLYDLLVRHEFRETVSVLEAKRKFVRFISHEVRTPLNTVCMGLKLLGDEMSTAIRSTDYEDCTVVAGASAAGDADYEDGDDGGGGDGGSIGKGAVELGPERVQIETTRASTMALQAEATRATSFTTVSETSKPMQRHMQSWIQLSQEIFDSAQSAVDVLNDILNYDKIEMELSHVPIFQLIEHIVGEFTLQARKAEVTLLFNASSSSKIYNAESNEDSCEGGEAVKLGQFTPNSAVDIEGGVTLAAASVCASESNSVSDVHKQCMLVGDSVRLTQVLRNLISNALKFTPEQGHVSITAEHSSEPSVSETKYYNHQDGNLQHRTFVLSNGEEVTHHQNGILQLTVTDTGAGMSERQVSQLFGEGVQFNVNALQSGQGSGLGLYIAKGIAEQHGGSLTVSSEGLGKGSCFTLLLPTYDASIEGPNLSHHDDSSHGLVTRPTNGSPSSTTISTSNNNNNNNNNNNTNRNEKSIVHNSSNSSICDIADTNEPIEHKPLAHISTSNSEALLANSTATTPTFRSHSASPTNSGTTAKINSATSTTNSNDNCNGNNSNNYNYDSCNANTTQFRILVVDDVASNRKMLMRLLKNKNHVCEEARDGQEAVDKYIAGKSDIIKQQQQQQSESDGKSVSADADRGKTDFEPYSTILMDYEMPVMNGPDATLQLRKLGCQCLIVGITGNVLPEDVNHYKSRGAQAVLPKPLVWADLQQIWSQHDLLSPSIVPSLPIDIPPPPPPPPPLFQRRAHERLLLDQHPRRNSKLSCCVGTGICMGLSRYSAFCSHYYSTRVIYLYKYV